MPKKLSRTVRLAFFQDDATGDFGTAHVDTLESPDGDAFNAFWDGTGLFHDVFEHSHEFTDKHFRGQYAMNVGGEMAASGAFLYYMNGMGVHNRLNNRLSLPPAQIMEQSTRYMVQEALTDGHCTFGMTLESNVPDQEEGDGELEAGIDLFWSKIEKNVADASIYAPGQTLLNLSNEYEEREIENRAQYAASVTKEKIANLHRYGYTLAENLVPCNNANIDTLAEFIEFWNDFCKNNNAETLCENFSGITFRIYTEAGEISWKATFESRRRDELKNYVIRQGARPIDIQDDIFLREYN